MKKESLLSMVEDGMSIRDIAAATQKSYTTVRYWLKKYGLSTENKSFADGYNKIRGNQYCTICACVLNEKNSYKRSDRESYSTYCLGCASLVAARKRANFKAKCIEFMGGSCKICGYTGSTNIFEFHHFNPAQKRKNISTMVNAEWHVVRKELEKCTLLCANCHRNQHCIRSKQKNNKNFFASFLLVEFSDAILIGKNTGMQSCKFCDKLLTSENRASGSHSHMCKKCDSKNVLASMRASKKNAVNILGGACSACGYSKCLSALELIQKKSTSNQKHIGRASKLWCRQRLARELKSYLLLCSNCSRLGLVSD